MIIWFCLSLAAKSASAYDNGWYDKKSGADILNLPSRRRLGDIKTTSDQREVSTKTL